jgi:hypothetical protein
MVVGIRLEWIAEVTEPKRARGCVVLAPKEPVEIACVLKAAAIDDFVD